MAEPIELTCINCAGKMKVKGRLDISEYTDKERQKWMTYRILADTYGLL